MHTYSPLMFSIHAHDCSVEISFCRQLYLSCTVYKEMSEAVKKHPEADVLINFASLRSAYDATMEAMTFDKVKDTHARARTHTHTHTHTHTCTHSSAP